MAQYDSFGRHIEAHLHEAILAAEDDVANKIAALGYDTDERWSPAGVTAIAACVNTGKGQSATISASGNTLLAALIAVHRKIRHHEAGRFLEPGEVIVEQPATAAPGRPNLGLLSRIVRSVKSFLSARFA